MRSLASVGKYLLLLGVAVAATFMVATRFPNMTAMMYDAAATSSNTSFVVYKEDLQLLPSLPVTAHNESKMPEVDMTMLQRRVHQDVIDSVRYPKYPLCRPSKGASTGPHPLFPLLPPNHCPGLYLHDFRLVSRERYSGTSSCHDFSAVVKEGEFPRYQSYRHLSPQQQDDRFSEAEGASPWSPLRYVMNASLAEYEKIQRDFFEDNMDWRVPSSIFRHYSKRCKYSVATTDENATNLERDRNFLLNASHQGVESSVRKDSSTATPAPPLFSLSQFKYAIILDEPSCVTNMWHGFHENLLPIFDALVRTQWIHEIHDVAFLVRMPARDGWAALNSGCPSRNHYPYGFNRTSYVGYLLHVLLNESSLEQRVFFYNEKRHSHFTTRMWKGELRAGVALVGVPSTCSGYHVVEKENRFAHWPFFGNHSQHPFGGYCGKASPCPFAKSFLRSWGFCI